MSHKLEKKDKKKKKAAGGGSGRRWQKLGLKLVLQTLLLLPPTGTGSTKAPAALRHGASASPLPRQKKKKYVAVSEGRK